MFKEGQIFDGPDRRIFRTQDKHFLIYEFRDGAVIYDGEEVAAVSSKPARNLKITAIIFKLLESKGLLTHFVKEAGEREMEIHATNYLPVMAICRNIATGRFAGRLGVPNGETLPTPVIEFHLDKHPLATRPYGDIITELTEGDVKLMQSRTITVNNILKLFFKTVGLTLADFRIEFGRDFEGRTRICGSFTPDTCRLWRSDTFEKIDRDRFRSALQGNEAAYIDVLHKIS